MWCLWIHRTLASTTVAFTTSLRQWHVELVDQLRASVATRRQLSVLSSRFSIKTQARGAMLDLLKRLADNGCRVVLTFPQGDASNGLNGEELVRLAREWFRVDATLVASRFSTLGGNGGNRSPRRRSGELVMTMKPL